MLCAFAGWSEIVGACVSCGVRLLVARRTVEVGLERLALRDLDKNYDAFQRIDGPSLGGLRVR
jgi:hypothetical protein